MFHLILLIWGGFFFLRHHHNGRWEARIGRVLGNKYLYLGTYGKFPFFVSVIYFRFYAYWLCCKISYPFQYLFYLFRDECTLARVFDNNSK